MKYLMIESDGKKATTDEAVQRIAAIPVLVQNSFDKSFARATSSVRIAVDDLIQGMDAADDLDSASMLQQIQAIPGEVRQITAVAVEEAVEDSQEQVAQQIVHARG